MSGGEWCMAIRNGKPYGCTYPTCECPGNKYRSPDHYDNFLSGLAKILEARFSYTKTAHPNGTFTHTFTPRVT